jgi:ribosomal protein L11 methyltransferase
MNYLCFSILTRDEELRGILIVTLSELGLESFQEEDDALHVYHPADDFLDEQEYGMRELVGKYKLPLERSTIKAQNWNELWESNFEPILVGDFCGIRADFHPPLTEVKHEMVINPEMAFGTGHHATTYMMIELMSGLAFRDRKVLDYGCGTGILAILAHFLGASPIDAVDIEVASYENTLVNAQRNQAEDIRVLHGTLESVVDSGYSIVLANINRNVILDTLPALRKKVQSEGHLLVSGILHSDQALIEQAAADAGFALELKREREGWIAMQFSRP